METKNVVNEAVMGTANNVNGSYHEVGGSKKATITEAVKYDTPSNIDNTDNDNVNDLIKMGLSGDQLKPCEKNINPITDSYIHPANIPRPLRMLKDWYISQGDYLIDVSSGKQHSTSEPPTAQPFDMCVYGEMCHHTEALAFALTKENRIGVIQILNVVDLCKGTVDSAVNEVIKTFPDNSVSVYYAPDYGSIDIIFKYGEGTEIESMEFTDSHNLRIRICSAGDFWKTRAYLYSIKYCSLVECAGVEKAIGAWGICKHSEEIQKSNEDQLITEGNSISETTVSDVTENKAEIEEYDFSDLFTPCEPDTINAAKETEPPDMIETTTQIEETQALCPDMESEIPDEELKKIQEIADSVKIPDGVPRTTEDGCFNRGALSDDTGDSPEVTLADFGATFEVLTTDIEAEPKSTIIVNKKGKRINTDSFPYVLKLIKNWVLYQVIYDRKVPKDSRTGKNAKSNDSSTWSSFDESVTGFVKYNADGIGIELTLVTYILVFDLDHIRNPETGELHPLVQEFLDMLPEGSVFVEISQSGTGLHLFFQYTEGLDLTIFTKCKMTAVFGENTCFECYKQDRYIAMTGNLLSEKFANIRPSTEVDKAITQIYKRCLDIYNGGKVNSKPKTDSKPAPALSRPAPKLSDDDVIRLAYRQNSKFRKLAEGDISDYDNDDSRADAAFFWILTYYTKDPQQLEKIYRRSPLSRDKFDRPWGESTYGQHLIDDALNNVTEQYYPQKKKTDFSISSLNEPFSFTISDLKSIPLDQISTAKFFSSIIRKIVAYVSDMKCFYVYSKTHWVNQSSMMLLKQLTKRFVQYINFITGRAVKEANDNEGTTDEDKAVLNSMNLYYRSYCKLSQRNKLIEDLMDELHHKSSEFDSDPYLLNVKNGIIDLKAFDPNSGRTEKLLPHDSRYMQTKIANVTYDEKAMYARFNQCIDEVMENDRDKTRYLQTSLGYTLLGESAEECLTLIVGTSTRNGKSLILDSVLNMLNTDSDGYGVQIDPDTILRTGGSRSGSQARPDIVRLRGARMILASEPARGSYLNEGLLKGLTGNDIQVARNLYQGEYISYRNGGSIFILANSSPSFDDDSIFKSGRLRIISFNRHFSREEQDITLKSQFRSEEAKSTILNFCLAGLADYFRYGLKPYKNMYAELEDYRYSCDYTQQFLNETVTVLPKNIAVSKGIQLSSLRKVYAKYAQDAGFKAFGLKDFLEDLIKHGVRVERFNNQYYAACRPIGEMDLNNNSSEDKESWRKIVK